MLKRLEIVRLHLSDKQCPVCREFAMEMPFFKLLAIS